MPATNTIQEQAAIIDTVAPLARDSDPKVSLASVHTGSKPVAGLRWPCANRVRVRLTIECEVRVRVKDESVSTREEPGPGTSALEPIVNADIWSFASAKASDTTNNVVCLEVAKVMSEKCRQSDL